MIFNFVIRFLYCVRETRYVCKHIFFFRFQSIRRVFFYLLLNIIGNFIIQSINLINRWESQRSRKEQRKRERQRVRARKNSKSGCWGKTLRAVRFSSVYWFGHRQYLSDRALVHQVQFHQIWSLCWSCNNIRKPNGSSHTKHSNLTKVITLSRFCSVTLK